MASTAKMTVTAAASATHAYQASLISQDSSGTKKARPNASPQANEPRRLRPASATTSSPGPIAASGQMSTGGNEAYSASPPATEMSSARPSPKPPNASPVPAPAAGPGPASAAATEEAPPEAPAEATLEAPAEAP